jgi:hypothetical protein
MPITVQLRIYTCLPKLKKISFWKKTPQEMSQIFSETIDQSASCLWIIEREKRLTASSFGRVCKLRASTDRKKVATNMVNSTFSGNIYTQYGLDNEPKAKPALEEKLGLQIQQSGLFISKEHSYLAATLDGLIGDNGIVEIKCPYSYNAKNFTPERRKQF